jgi:hypothetical protein
MKNHFYSKEKKDNQSYHNKTVSPAKPYIKGDTTFFGIFSKIDSTK